MGIRVATKASGEARGAATTAGAPPPRLPQGGRGGCAGGGAGESAGRPRRGLSLTPPPVLSLRPRKLTATQQGLALSCTARSLEAVNLVSITCNQPLVHNAALCLGWGPRPGSCRPSCPPVPRALSKTPRRESGRSRVGVQVPASHPKEARAHSPEDPEGVEEAPGSRGPGGCGEARPLPALGRSGDLLPARGGAPEGRMQTFQGPACASDPAAQPR